MVFDSRGQLGFLYREVPADDTCEDQAVGGICGIHFGQPDGGRGGKASNYNDAQVVTS